MGFSVLQRGDLNHEILIWFLARDTETDATRGFGFWTGIEDITLTVESEVRDYAAGGSIVGVDAITASKGLSVETQRVVLSAIHSDIENMLRGYDARQAPCQIHVLRRDPLTNAKLGFDRPFKGFLNVAPITSGQIGGDAIAEAELLGSEYLLTKGLSSKKSHEAQQLRQGDPFMKYATTSGSETIYWGTRAYVPPTPAPTPAPGVGNWWDYG